MTQIDAAGSFDPRAAGTGSVTAVSSYGPSDTTGAVIVTPGRAASLAVSPNTLSVSADAAPVAFSVTGTDADGNATADLGTITWSSNVVTQIDPSTGSFDPRAAGTGSVTATSSHGASDTSGAVTVTPGRAASLDVAPDTLALNADDLPALFTVAAYDADGNATADVGTLTWSTTGPITTIDSSTGFLDPVTAGTGAVRATSSYGATDDSGAVTIVPGAAFTLTVAPDTLTINADAAPATFTVTATDADGNATTDVGTVTWASAVVTSIDASTGVFTPVTAGTGSVTATSSHGATDTTGAVNVVPGRAVSIAVVPDTLTLGADEPPVTFTATGVDSDGNATSDVGTITWSSAGVSGIDANTGVFDPSSPSTGTITATSSYGISDTSGTITVTAGRAVSITVSPDTLTISADGAPVTFTVTGVDVDGNPTTDLGTITWSATTVTEIDSSTGVFTPKLAGTGTVTAVSSHGPSDTTGAITVTPGRAATLAVAPDTLTINADAGPTTFTVTGTDADGNATADLGTIAWSSSVVSSMDATTGVFTPVVAGTGSVRATSTTYSIFDDSGAVTVVPGRVVSFAVTPDTATLSLGGASATFSAAGGVDADGNATTDYGVLTWSIASGTIGNIASATGVLTPTLGGVGTVRAASSYGPSDVTSEISIHDGVVVDSISVPASILRGQQNVKVTVVLQNTTAAAANIVGGWLTFAAGGADRGADYVVEADARNPWAVPGNGTATLTFWVDVAASPVFGSVEITARMESVKSNTRALGGHFARTSWTVVNASPPSAVISAPIAPNEKLCTSGSTSFQGSASTGAAPLSYFWELVGGSPATSAAADPTGVSYGSIGIFPYWLTVTDGNGDRDTAAHTDAIHVGAPAPNAQRYPVGRVRLVAPTPSQAVNIASLPSGAYIDMDASGALTACNGAALGIQADYLTAFVDRGVLVAADADATLAGTQVDLVSGSFDNLVLGENNAATWEGDAIVYLEHRKQPDGIVTAAGWQSFRLTNDSWAPTLAPGSSSTLPKNDCAPNCYGKGWRWIFLFSEPMDEASMANLVVEKNAVADCTGSGSWTPIAGSSIRYDRDLYAVFVTPPAQPEGSYAIRVRSTAGTPLRDASSNGNALAPISRCQGLTALADPPTPNPPANLTISNLAISPDGDGTAEFTDFDFDVDLNSEVGVLEIRRDGKIVNKFGAFKNSGKVRLRWNGRDSTGRVVRDGHYHYRIRVENAVGQSSPTVIEGSILVDSAIDFVGVPYRL